MALDLGATVIRTSHYPENQAFYDYCDQVGMLVFTEVGLQQNATSTNPNSAFVNNLNDQLTEMIKQKSAPTVAKAEPVPTATPATAANPAAANPATANPAPTTAGVENPAPADSGNTKTHTVAKGETLTQISKQYGVSVDEIEQLNKIGDAKKLQAGQTIKIPVSAGATPSPTP